MVIVKTRVGFQPFPVPEGVKYAMDGIDPENFPMMDLCDIGQDAFDALAGRWLDNLYANIGLPSPWLMEPCHD